MNNTNYLVASLCDIISSDAGTVDWQGSHRDLVELVVAVAATGELRDGRGLPLSTNELARRAYRAAGLTPPHHVAAIAYQLRNRLRDKLPLATRVRWQRRRRANT